MLDGHLIRGHAGWVPWLAWPCVCCVGVCVEIGKKLPPTQGGEGKEACLLPSLPASSARRVILIIIDPNHTPTPLSHTRQARPLSCCPRVHGCSRAFDRGCSPIMISGEPTSQPPPSHALKLNQTPTPTHTTHTGIKPRPRLVPSPAPWTSESSYSRRYVRSYLPPFFRTERCIEVWSHRPCPLDLRAVQTSHPHSQRLPAPGDACI